MATPSFKSTIQPFFTPCYRSHMIKVMSFRYCGTPARCKIAGTTSTPLSLLALCRNPDALKGSGINPHNNFSSQIFSPGRTPAIRHKAPFSLVV